MKQLLLTLICVTASISAFSQQAISISDFLAKEENPSESYTIRACFEEYGFFDVPGFYLVEGQDTLKVSLGEYAKETVMDLFKMDVRQLDTLTVFGIRAPKSDRAKSPDMTNAVIIAKNEFWGHDDFPAFPLSVEQAASFQGQGLKGFTNWGNEHLVYPESAREAEAQGNVSVTFIIDKNGHLINLQIKESSGDYALDEEACRVILSAPDWFPAMINGKPTNVRYYFSIKFRLSQSPYASFWQ